MSILSPFKPIIKSNVSLYMEAFGNDDYETKLNKLKIIDKVKEDKDLLKREQFDNFRDYEKMLKEKYEGYKQSLAIVGAIGDDGGSAAPHWFKNAVKYNGEFVKYNGEIVTYKG